MKSALRLVLATERVDFPAGLEAVDLETLAMAVEIADEEAETVVRSYGVVRLAGGVKTLWSPKHNPDIESEWVRAADYLVRRRLATRLTAKSIKLP